MITPTNPIAFVRYYNAWRVGGDMDQPDPSTITRMLAELCDHAEQLERELAAERALADRLAEALDGLCWIATNPPRALAAWKDQRKNQTETDDDQARDPA